VADKKLTHIRLPLQIGTSALWSLARTSVAFPGLVIVVLGLWLSWEIVRDGSGGDNGDGAKIGLAIAAAGGVLVGFAYIHFRRLLAERPSDVLLDEKGLRVEGGIRDGLVLAWADIDRGRCRIATTEEERVTTWRLILNLPLIAVSLFGGDDATVGLQQKVRVHRLFVARDGEPNEMLVAEADVEVEHLSLATLLRTIRSSRWHPRSAPMPTPSPAAPAQTAQSPKRGGKRKRSKHEDRTVERTVDRTSDRPAAIVCATCGAVVAPSADESATCRSCSATVRIPDDVRRRVEAASALDSARRSGMTRIERLLATQPSARFARANMWAAAIPIAVAWPLAGALVLHNVHLGMITPGRIAALALLPLLLMMGAFLLARGRLTDRFALHAVIIGFGAREPPRPGEPYRCRSCGASLPEATTTPVVHCVYCDKSNVLGLDLTGEAAEASDEHRHLEDAFADREKERVRWRLAGVAALAMIVASVALVRGTFADIARVDFTPRTYAVTSVTVDPPDAQEAGMPPIDKAESHVTWTARIEPAHGVGVNCHVKLLADAEHQSNFDYDHEGRCTFSRGVPVRYSDAWTSSKDRPASVEIDLRKKRAVIRGKQVDGDDVRSWKVTLQLSDTPE
jgi:hypothetical protein